MINYFDDLSRNVFCLLGVPVDNITVSETLDYVEAAQKANQAFLLATPNVNFIATAAFDDDFRDTLFCSDLCVPDGVWLVLLGRLLGIPLTERVAGADLMEALKQRRTREAPVKLCFFGGSDAAGERACEAINTHNDGLCCVGAINPGFGSVEEMSADDFISAVNATAADVLLVALGAKKGQSWLHANHARLTVPVRAHMGATINFYAGAIKRAPLRLQRWGLEWAWRIKEEPSLWRRYAHDGAVVAGMLVNRVAPLLLWLAYLRLRRRFVGECLTLDKSASRGRGVLSLGGALTAGNADAISSALREALDGDDSLVLDLSGARAIDARFAGLLCMLQKALARRGQAMRIVKAPILIRWVLALYGCEIPARTPEIDPLPTAGVAIGATE